jgi:A/G-specific adenine glycosylase
MEVAVIDINVTRVLRHTFNLSESLSPHEFREIAASLIPPGRSRERHNALMDYGALVLHSKATGIQSVKQSTFAGSDREVR